MTAQVLVSDASPLLTFLASGHQDLLLGAIDSIGARLVVTEEVVEEVFRKAEEKQELAPAGPRMDWMIRENKIAVLSSDLEPGLNRKAAEVFRSYNPTGELKSRDLGENVSIAHAALMRGRGEDAKVFIQEWRGQERAKSFGVPVVDCASILRRCAREGLIRDRGEMRRIWDRMQPLDLSMLHWDQEVRLHDRGLYGGGE